MTTLGIGPLQVHLDNPDINEVMVVNGEEVWVEDAVGIRRCGSLSHSELSLTLERIARASGRRLDLLSPILDARLSDGSRACAVIPPVAVAGAIISIRKFPRRILPLAAFGPTDCVEIVDQLIHTHTNVVISGATSSGKTSLLSSVSQRFLTNERVLCVEDTAELRFAHPHVVRMQTRPSSPEGAGEITLQDLVRASLRLRPDRLLVGEVRGAEVVDMLLALSSGHQGCWSTVHATNATDTLERLAAMVLRDSPQWSHSQSLRTIHRAVGAVIHIERISTRKRCITEIIRISDSGDITYIYGGQS